MRRALPWLAIIAPVALALSVVFRGVDGLISAAIGLAIGVGNLVLAAWMLERGARRGGNALLMAALGGFGFRMVLLTLVLWGFSRLEFVDFVVLGFVLVGTHLALLTIEAVTLTNAERGQRDVAMTRLARSSIDSSDVP